MCSWFGYVGYVNWCGCIVIQAFSDYMCDLVGSWGPFDEVSGIWAMDLLVLHWWMVIWCHWGSFGVRTTWCRTKTNCRSSWIPCILLARWHGSCQMSDDVWVYTNDIYDIRSMVGRGMIWCDLLEVAYQCISVIQGFERKLRLFGAAAAEREPMHWGATNEHLTCRHPTWLQKEELSYGFQKFQSKTSKVCTCWSC